jgi:hypothetical protein
MITMCRNSIRLAAAKDESELNINFSEEMLVVCKMASFSSIGVFQIATWIRLEIVMLGHDRMDIYE